MAGAGTVVPNEALSRDLRNKTRSPLRSASVEHEGPGERRLTAEPLVGMPEGMPKDLCYLCGREPSRLPSVFWSCRCPWRVLINKRNLLSYAVERAGFSCPSLPVWRRPSPPATRCPQHGVSRFEDLFSTARVGTTSQSVCPAWPPRALCPPSALCPPRPALSAPIPRTPACALVLYSLVLYSVQTQLRRFREGAFLV